MAKKQFKSESKRLLDLMINSIYTHKEIFLREIISNASDAIDKLCFISLTDDKVGLDRGDFKIVLKPDKESRTLTITDNGIGMIIHTIASGCPQGKGISIPLIVMNPEFSSFNVLFENQLEPEVYSFRFVLEEAGRLHWDEVEIASVLSSVGVIYRRKMEI